MKKVCTFKALLLLLATGFYFSACDMTPKSGKQNKIAFDSTLIDKTCYLLDNPENPHCNLQIKFIYPTQMDNALLPEIQKQFVNAYFGEAYDTPMESELARQAFMDCPSISIDYGVMEKSDRVYVSNTIRFNQDGLLCFSVNFENYTGGAHGAHSYNHFVLDVNTGKRITEEDIFVDSYQDSLAEILVAQITKQNELSDPKELENIGFFSVDEIYPNNNFFVDETGITYTFNEYEIAAYVVGPVHVHLSFDEVQYLLKPETPITQLIN